MCLLFFSLQFALLNQQAVHTPKCKTRSIFHSPSGKINRWVHRKPLRVSYQTDDDATTGSSGLLPWYYLSTQSMLMSDVCLQDKSSSTSQLRFPRFQNKSTSTRNNLRSESSVCITYILTVYEDGLNQCDIIHWFANTRSEECRLVSSFLVRLVGLDSKFNNFMDFLNQTRLDKMGIRVYLTHFVYQ